MTDKAIVAEAIKAAPEQAAAALLAVQLGDPNPVTMAGLTGAARFLNRNVEDVAAEEIDQRGLLDSFALAMKARGVKFDPDDAGLEDANFPADLLDAFIPRGKAFRCRVLVNGRFSGSGCLISPSLVMTAWHVIASSAPCAANLSYGPIEVTLSDGSKRHAAVSYVSPCTELEWAGKLPTDDATFRGYNDVALITLERPDGMRLGFAELPVECLPVRSRSSILLLHFPQGNDVGFGFGKIAKVRGVTGRWKHDVLAADGSSGGPCFTTRFALAGLHQGKWAPVGRLVPAALFLDDIRPLIEGDIAPSALWSLDGTAHGQLVIGRDLFFEAIAAASRPSTRVRGIRVKRRDLAQGTTGLAFSFEMLKFTLARNPGKHRIVRINFEATVSDLLEEIRRRVVAVGVNIPPVEADAGARSGETTLEAAMNDRALNLNTLINAAVERDQQLIWFLFENPPAGMADAERLAFEAFIGTALRQPRLRLVLTGFETITTPSEEFANASVESEGAPGMVVEYFGLFNRADVATLLARACRDFGVAADMTLIADRANQILLGLAPINGQYSAADLEMVCERAVPHLEYFKSQQRAQP